MDVLSWPPLWCRTDDIVTDSNEKAIFKLALREAGYTSQKSQLLQNSTAWHGANGPEFPLQVEWCEEVVFRKRSSRVDVRDRAETMWFRANLALSSFNFEIWLLKESGLFAGNWTMGHGICWWSILASVTQIVVGGHRLTEGGRSASFGHYC